MAAQTQILDLSGLNVLLQKLTALGKKADTIAGAALYQEAEAIMTKSKEQCPVDFGNLRATGTVAPPENRGGHMVVELGYGGPAVKYAIVQHEAMNYQHTVGKAKYLEDPMLEAVNGMEQRLGQRIAKGIEDAAR